MKRLDASKYISEKKSMVNQGFYWDQKTPRTMSYKLPLLVGQVEPSLIRLNQ